MTAVQALAALQSAGKIKTPWARGMSVTHPRTPGGGERGTICDVQWDGKRIVVWDGVGVVRYTHREDGWVVEVYGEDDGLTAWTAEAITQHASPRTWELDLDDDATVGCVIGLLTEARSSRLYPRASAVANVLADLRVLVGNLPAT